jgi:hypothetical protein
VGTIREVKPPADDIRLFQPIILDAYEIACPGADVLNIQSQLRFTKSKIFVVVRCGQRRTRAVRVVYTGVSVPNLIGSDAHSLSTLAAMLVLDLSESNRPARTGEEPNTIVRQNPPPGSNVPFGTTLRVLVAN